MSLKANFKSWFTQGSDYHVNIKDFFWWANEKLKSKLVNQVMLKLFKILLKLLKPFCNNHFSRLPWWLGNVSRELFIFYKLMWLWLETLLVYDILVKVNSHFRRFLCRVTGCLSQNLITIIKVMNKGLSILYDFSFGLILDLIFLLTICWHGHVHAW